MAKGTDMKCNLLYKDTKCSGRKLVRALEENTFVKSCEEHYRIFKLLQQLRSLEVTTEEIQSMSIKQMVEKLKELQQREQKILAD